MEGDDEPLSSRLEEAAESRPDDPSHHFNLGLFFWGREGREWREKAAEQFMLAAKLNPQNGEAFRYLGDYYSETDTQRALKCYQRAVSLNPVDSHSGEALCNLLDKDGKESLELAICREVSAKSPRAFWAFCRLGCLLVHQNKWSEAVTSLQNAIRGYPTCADLWEALGLAYQRLGMYTAAIKSYGRAMELEDSRVFSMIESGNTFLMLGSYRKGIDSFQKALEVYPQNVSARYGLASGLLALSKECINMGAFVWAASLLEEAAEIVKSTAMYAGNISCIWKLHGDIKFTFAKYFPWIEGGTVLESNEKSLATSISAWQKMRFLAAEQAKCSYQRALHLAPWEANVYTDTAMSLDLSFSLECCELDLKLRQLPEKMTLGSLLLEGDNYDFWVALGRLSCDGALKQHAFIRGLQLDVSLAVAWAYLGMLYRDEGDKQLARQAFDRARSIDPSLALPWAGMSADIHARDPASDEAYESCLRAVQIMPLAESQIGLVQLALPFGQILSAQVFCAIRQAVQQAPYYPETHNLNGLMSEARGDYESAIASYRLARLALKAYTCTSSRSHFNEVTINLARAFCKAGYALDAIQELDLLKNDGSLDAESLQLYAVSLWLVNKNDLALSVTRDLALCTSSMGSSFSAGSITLICRLLYTISGLRSAISSISKMPKQFFQTAKVSFVVSAISALDVSNSLESVVSSSRNFVSSHEEITEMHLLIALSKMLKTGSDLQLQAGLRHLRKVLHIYPNSDAIRNSLSYFLFSSSHRENSHVGNRCYSTVLLGSSNNEGFKSSHKILGAEAVACHASTDFNLVFTSSTCKYSALQRATTTQQMQRWLRQEPWNENANYLLILSLLQKAREARYPEHLLAVLRRMIPAALSSNFYQKKHTDSQYPKFQLLLGASEIFLQSGDVITSVSFANDASNLSLPDGHLFFAHLQMCRAYASEADYENLKEHILRCLNIQTDHPIGWICLKFIESLQNLQIDQNLLDYGFGKCLKNCGVLSNMWMAVYKLVCGLTSLHSQDCVKAEGFLVEACSLTSSESGIYLCHGAICMELARRLGSLQYLNSAVKSLQKALEVSSVALPFVSLLLAQAEGSLGSKAKWERNLRLELRSWPPVNKPAELYFQGHLLAIQATDQASSSSYVRPEKWVLRAIHLNPSCSRYWRTLWKLLE